MNTTSVFDTDTVTDLSTVWNTTGNVTEAPSGGSGGLPPLGYYGHLRQSFWKIVPPFIIIIGTIGNSLTITVLLRQMKRLSSTALFLTALAVSDTVILWCGPFRNWLANVWDHDVRFLSDSGCKSQLFLTYVSIHVSSWLLVAVTMERAISVVFPHKVKIGFTNRNAVIIIASIVGVICAIDIIVPVMVSLDDTYRERAKCAPRTKELHDFRDYYWQWIDFTVAFALPFIILVGGNIIIVVKLAHSRKNKKKMQAARGSGGSSKETSVSVLLIFLSVLFFFTMSPVTIFSIYYPYRYEELLKMKFEDGYYGYEKLMFGHVIVNLIGYTNAAFNFILYVFSGQKFRRELISLFRCRPAGQTSAFGVKTTSKSAASATKTTNVKTHPIACTNAGFVNEGNTISESAASVETAVNASDITASTPVNDPSPVSTDDIQADLIGAGAQP